MHLDALGDVAMHGPARITEKAVPLAALAPSDSGLRFTTGTSLISMDEIYCVRCLMWPPQAADWPSRQRNHGWPDSATVDRVVSNGCDVVPVAHYLCRQNEWLSKLQRRMSFSRAEIVLLNSLMPVQQIVYHMLRVFMKTERLTDSAANFGAGTLSNYHIKTLMLWACELKSRSWWTDDLNLVRICVELLHTLAVWLTDARCQHYFINNCNLFDRLEKSQFTEVTASRLMSITRASFCEWCIDSYIHKCAQLCPSSVSSSLWSSREQLNPVLCLENVVSEFVRWRMDTSLKMTFINLLQIQWHIVEFVFQKSLTLRSCLCWMDQLANTDKTLRLYFTAVVFLHGAYKTAQCSLTYEMLDVLAATCLQLNDARRFLNARHSSVLSLRQAARLMKVVANNPRNTMQLIEIELAKAYLHRTLRCKDSDSASIYCLVNVYLAVLYYTTRQYQEAIDHCALVTRLQDQSLCSSHVVQGEILPRIDDQVDSILGLAVFYQYIQASALNEEEVRRHVSVFTTDLFARYLHVRFLSVTECRQLAQTSLTDEVRRYRNYLCNSPEVLVTDVMVFNVVNPATYPPNDRLMLADRGETKSLILDHLDISKLVELLQQSAVEHLTACRKLEARDFGSLGHVVTSDFKALYAYKCGEYRDCLQLSAYNVDALIGGKRPCGVRAGVRVLLRPELIQLMDDDIVSLLGLMMLVNHSQKSEPPRVAISQLSLSLYLMTQCQIKLRHSVTSLARTFDYVQTAFFEIRGLHEPTVDQLILNFLEQKMSGYGFRGPYNC